LLTDRQTNKQTNKNWQKHNLLGGGNNIWDGFLWPTLYFILSSLATVSVDCSLITANERVSRVYNVHVTSRTDHRSVMKLVRFQPGSEFIMPRFTRTMYSKPQLNAYF